ncbi:MAG: glycosyltransferase family 2 protein [Pseudomonadota bacterium]
MNNSEYRTAASIAVVIPSYKVAGSILDVIGGIGPEVRSIYVVDDKCPEQSGKRAEGGSTDPRVQVLYNEENMGVGGATMAGLSQALKDGATVIVKIDGDGQMDPAYIPYFCSPILAGEADFTKGNRFFEPESVAAMPRGRLFGNMGLSFLAKLSSGYWTVMDPTNGYIAIHGSVAALLRPQKVAKRFFFESDLLFHLNLLGARVVGIPMDAAYGDEESNLNPIREIPRFAGGHLRNTFKRIIYSYFIRDFSLASLELVFGAAFLLFGIVFGALNWSGGTLASAGTVMLAALPVIVGVQLLLSFLNFDVNATPSTTLHPRLMRTAIPSRTLRRVAAPEPADDKVEAER